MVIYSRLFFLDNKINIMFSLILKILFSYVVFFSSIWENNIEVEDYHWDILYSWVMSNDERLKITWLKNKNIKLLRDIDMYPDLTRYSYNIINLKNYPFSILIPNAVLSNSEKEYCIESKQCITNVSLKEITYDSSTYPANYKWHKTALKVSSYIRGDYLWDIEITENNLNWKSFEEIMEENAKHWENTSKERFLKINLALYYDNEWNLFFDKESAPFYYEMLLKAWNKISPLTEDKTNLNKWYLWYWKNFQQAIKEWNAKLINAVWADFIRLSSNPDKYYVIYNTNIIPDKTNMIRVVDLYNEDWTSPFIENN